jgi:XrtJ-associated TM-motif-TM protein
MPSRSRVTSLFVVALAISLVPAICQGQGGCIDSPENPTALLALVGVAGAAVPLLRSRLRSRRSSTTSSKQKAYPAMSRGRPFAFRNDAFAVCRTA